MHTEHTHTFKHTLHTDTQTQRYTHPKQAYSHIYSHIAKTGHSTNKESLPIRELGTVGQYVIYLLREDNQTIPKWTAIQLI